MSLSASPWVRQLKAALNLDALDERLMKAPKDRIDLSCLNEFNAEVVVERTLRQCYVPGESSIKAITQILALTLDRTEQLFPSTREYLLNVNSINVSTPPPTTVCLTGLAGVGKSAIFEAVQGLIGKLPEISIAGHGRTEHTPISRIQILNRWGSREISQHFGLPSSGGNITRWLYQNGCGLIALDELQFLATSASANTRASKLIYSMSLFGPVLVFACNFSLGHKLLKRPHEERSRMLVSPIVIVPDLAESLAWKNRVRVWATALESCLEFDLSERSHDLWNLVIGLNRCAIRLLSLSAALAANQKTRIRWEIVESAYRSSEFSAMREDIEGIRSISLGGERRRSDLICPFESMATGEYLAVVRNARKATFSLSVGISAQVESLKKTLKDDDGESAPKKKMPRLPKPLDAATLINSAENFRTEVRMGRARRAPIPTSNVVDSK